MGFLDDLGKAAKQLGHGLAQIPGDIGEATVAPFGFILDVASAPFTDDDKSFMEAVKSSAAYNGKQILGAVGDQPENLKDVALGTLNVANTNWEYQMSRPGATLEMVVGPRSIGDRDPFKGRTWADAWNASEDINLGEASFGEWVGGFGEEARKLGVPASAVQNTLGVYGQALLDSATFGLYTGDESKAKSITALTDPDYDYTDPEQRQAAYGAGLGKAGGALMEFGARWYFDPLYLAGKGAMAYRAANVTKPIKTAQDAEDALVTGVRDRKGLGRLAADRGIVAPQTQGTGTDKFFADLDKLKTPEERADWLSRNKGIQYMLRHSGDAGPAVLHQLANATTAQARADYVRLAMEVTPRNARILAREAESLEAAAFNIQDTNIRLLDRMLADGQFQHLQPMLKLQMRQAQHEMGVLNRMYPEFLRMSQTPGSMRFAPRTTTGQRLSDAVGFPVFQASRWNLPGRVYKSALTKRGQTIDLNRPGEAAFAVKNALDRFGHGLGRLGEGHGLSAREKGDYVLRVTQATTVAERAAALRSIEDDLVRLHASRLNANEENFRLLVDVTRSKRDGLRASYGAQAGSVFSGATDDAGRPLDAVYLGEDGVMERIAMSHTDVANKLPMIDMDGLADVVRRFPEFGSMPPAELRAMLNGWRPSRGRQFRMGGTIGLDYMARLWKPSQLMRLGWPIRVLVDEQLRIMAHVGVLGMIPLWSESVAVSLANSRLPGKTLGLIDKANPFRASDLQRKVMEESADRMLAAKAALQEKRMGRLEAIGPAPKSYLPNSVVRGDDGELLTVYHGASKPFDKFDDEAVATGAAAGWYGRGHYLSVDPRYASRYPVGNEGANVRMANLNMNKVWDWEKDVLTRAEAAALVTKLGRDPDEILNVRHVVTGAVQRPMADSKLTLENLDVKMRVGAGRNGGVLQDDWNNAVRDILERKGYQGIRHNELLAEGSGVREIPAYVVFRAKHIKDPHGSTRQKARAAKHDEATAKVEEQYAAGIEAWVRTNHGMSKAEIDQLWAGSGLAANYRKSREGKHKFAGERTATDATGREQSYGDVFWREGEGSFDEMMMSLVSANANYRILMSGTPTSDMPDAILGAMRQGAGNPTTIRPVTDSVIQAERDAHDLAYTIGWEKAANEQMGMDPIFGQILKGETDERIVAWLRYSKEGRALRKEHPIRANVQGLEKWVATLRQQVDTYLPSQPLRDLALQGKARVSHLNTHFDGDLAQRPVVHGESIDNDRGTSWFWKNWDKLVERQYKYLGGAPTNVLSRHPYSAYVYRAEMDRQIANWSPDIKTAGGGDGKIPHDELEKMRAKAREHTIGEVRTTLYELANQSNLAHTFRFLMPFYQAWQEVLTTWGRLALADPSRISRLNTLWEAPSRLDVTYKDPQTGEEFVALPNILKPLYPGSGDEMHMPTAWVRQLMFNNEFWFTPGLGPTVQVPVNHFLRDMPTIEDNVKFLAPYGSGESIIKDFLPTSLRRYANAHAGEDGRTKASTLARVTQDLIVGKNLGEHNMTEVQMRAEAVRRTDAMMGVLSSYSWLLPFSPKFPSPHQLYLDFAKAMRIEYEGKDGVGGYPDGKDENGKGWKEAYIDKYGADYFAFTESLTKSNTGLPANELGFEAMEKYGDLIAERPELGSLVAGDIFDDAEYSTAVSRYQMTHDIGPGTGGTKQREQYSPEALIEKEQRDRGWDEFRKMNLMVTTQMAANGIKSLSDPRARRLANYKRTMVAAYADQFPAWGTDYRQFSIGGPKETISFINTHLDDTRLDNRPGWEQMRSYMATRGVMVAQLAMRRAKGGSANLEAKANADLKRVWDASIAGLKFASIDFDEMYSRYLDNDRLLDGG